MKCFIKAAIATVACIAATHSFAVTQSSPVSAAERSKIEGVVHDYLLSNPEIIVQAVQTLQQKQYQEAEKTVKQTQQIASSFSSALFHAANDPVAGNPNGAVTVVEFFDYQCPHCVDMAAVFDGIIKANPNVRIIFKDFPIRGPASELAARAALAANKQGKYYQFSHALLTAGQPLSEDSIMKIAKNVGLNTDQMKKDMDSDSIKNQLKANMKLAQDLKLFGTPAIFIGKTNATSGINYVPGQMNQTQMQEMIDKNK